MTTALISERVHPAAEAVEAMGAALDRLAAADLSSLPASEVGVLVIGLERLGRRVAAAQLVALGQAEVMAIATTTGATSTAAWLHQVTGLAAGVGKARLELRQALADRPITTTALAAGDVGTDGAAAVCAAVAALPASVPVAMIGEIESELVVVAREDGARAVAQRAAEIGHRFAPDDLAAIEARQVRDRRLTVTSCSDGTVQIRGTLDREAGGVVWSVLGAFAAPQPAVDGVPDGREAPARYADALLGVCRLASASGEMPAVRGDRATVVITMGLDALLGRLGQAPGALETGAVISAGAARRLACDARLVPIVLGSASEPLDIGRATSLVPQPMRRALVARDTACAFPGCDRPPGWCDAHHIRHWADGGDTAIGNLVLVCGEHHRAVHHDGWSVGIGTDQRPWFTPPDWLDSSREPRQHHRYRANPLDP